MPLVGSYNDATLETRSQQTVLMPRNLEQLVAIIKAAKEKGEKLRPSGVGHSTNSIILGESPNYIRTNNLKRIGEISTYNGKDVVTVESGVTLGELTEHLAEKGFSLGFGFPAFRGLSIGGLVATGSHGTSRKHPAVSAHYIEAVQMVLQDGTVLNVDRSNPELFKAATVNLGMLGVVYQLKLRIEPKFNVAMQVQYVDDARKDFFGNDRSKLIFWTGPNDNPHAPQEDSLMAIWFPHANKVVRYVGTKTNLPVNPGSEFVIFGLDNGYDATSHLVNNVLAKTNADPEFAMQFETKRYDRLVSTPPFVVEENGADKFTQQLVGPSNKMLLARGNSEIRWLYTFDDFSFAFPEEKAYDVLKTIEEFAFINKFAFPLSGLLMRFAKSDPTSSYLSHLEREGQSPKLYVMAEFAQHRPFNFTIDEEKEFQSLRSKLMKVLLEKHQVSFHWGKNVDRVLSDGSKVYGSNVSNFRKIVEKLDPNGMFSGPLVSKILFKNKCVSFYETAGSL